MIASNVFIGTNGILSTDVEGRPHEFFRIREIFRARSEGSYLAVDCDIKDHEGKREVKLFKSNPVAKSDEVEVKVNKTATIACRQDGEVIIKIVQEEINTPVEEFPIVKQLMLGWPAALKERIKGMQIDAVIKITGNFSIGAYQLIIDENVLSINGTRIGANTKFGTGGIRLLGGGLAM